MTRALVVALTLLLSLAVAPGAAQAAPRVVPFAVTVEDGTVLRGDVYLPDREGPLGTVLQLGPYWNTAVKGPGSAQGGSEAVRPFVDAGFAVALINLRGTGASDGCFQWGSRTDWGDAGAVVEALADAPWSNGNVGMYGTSYEGWTQYMAMAAAPPSLKAVVPISGVIDVWSLLARQGAPISVGPPAAATFGGATAFGTAEPALVDHARCPEFAEHVAQGLELARSGDRTDYYHLRDLRAELAGSRVPVLMTNGLTFVQEGHELQFEGLWDLLGGQRRFVLGQWGHGGTRDDFTELAIGWFDHHLRGGPAVTRPGVVDYQDNRGGWHAAPQWPPTATATRLNLSGDALLPSGRPIEPSRRSFQSAPADLVLDTLDVEAEPLTGGNGPGCGPHQVLYASPPLAQDVLLAGNFSVDLPVGSTLPGGNLVATLYHAPGGTSCPSLLARAQDAGRVQLDLRHWSRPGASSAFPIGALTRVRADSLPLATTIPAGHRLVLAVGAGSAEILPDPLQPRITIGTGGGLPASLTLPVVDGRLAFAG